jgi:hypothetical protein
MASHEANAGSLALPPAALHLPFKVTWADTSRCTPDLLLDPRMDKWGQGTFTLFVSRLYRRAIGIARKAPSATFPFFVQVVEHHLG